MLRKAIGLATVTLDVSEYTEPDPTTSEPITHIDIVQTLSGGLAGNTEKRVLNWAEGEHEDYIFGKVIGRTRLIRGSTAADDRVRPNVEVQTRVEGKEGIVEKFLKGEIAADGKTPTEGFLVDEIQDGERFGEGEGLWVQGIARSVNAGWTVEQVCSIFLSAALFFFLNTLRKKV
jgi:hypothetical protein